MCTEAGARADGRTRVRVAGVYADGIARKVAGWGRHVRASKGTGPS